MIEIKADSNLGAYMLISAIAFWLWRGSIAAGVFLFCMELIVLVIVESVG